MVGTWQIIIILVILLLFFGPSRLEKLGPSLGKALRGFKKSIDGKDDEEEDSEESSKKIEDKKSDNDKTKKS